MRLLLVRLITSSLPLVSITDSIVVSLFILVFLMSKEVAEEGVWVAAGSQSIHEAVPDFFPIKGGVDTS